MSKSIWYIIGIIIIIIIIGFALRGSSDTEIDTPVDEEAIIEEGGASVGEVMVNDEEAMEEGGHEDDAVMEEEKAAE